MQTKIGVEVQHFIAHKAEEDICDREVQGSLPAGKSRTDLPAKARKVQLWERWLILWGLIFISSASWLHDQLLHASRQYVEKTGMFDHWGVDWFVMYRAGIWSRQSSIHADSEHHPLVGQSLPKDARPHPLVGPSEQCKQRGCFFADVGVLARTIVVPIQGAVWRADLLHRLQRTSLPEDLCRQRVDGDWRCNGRPVADMSSSASLLHCPLRLNFPGLVGGMQPKATSDYKQMSLKDLKQLCGGTPHQHQATPGSALPAWLMPAVDDPCQLQGRNLHYDKH